MNWLFNLKLCSYWVHSDKPWFKHIFLLITVCIILKPQSLNKHSVFSFYLSLIYRSLIKYQNGNCLLKFKQNTTESYDLTKQIYFSELTALMSIIASNVSMCVCSGGKPVYLKLAVISLLIRDLKWMVMINCVPYNVNPFCS